MNELDRDRFEQLVGLADAYLMGELDAPGLAALEQMVCEDSAAADALAQYLRQAGALREGLAESAKAERESSEPELGEYLSILSELKGAQVQPVDLTDELARRKAAGLKRGRRRSAGVDADSPLARVMVIPRPVVWLAGAAAILLLTLVFWPSATPPGRTPNHAGTQDPGASIPAPAVGRVVSSVDARWATPLDAGGVLRAGQPLTLTQGLVEITFNDGAHVILQAPATLEPTGTNGLRLVSGKLTASVPPSAHGFTVDTPAGRVTDYGTEFGVHVNPDGQTLAHTFTGRIGLTPIGGGEEVSLFSGDAIVASMHGQVRTVEPDTMGFVREVEYAARRDANFDPHARWLAYSYELRRMDGLVAYYPVDSDSQANGIIYNRASSTGAALNGRMGSRVFSAQAPQWVAGRVTGKPALFYDGQRRMVVVEDQDALNDLAAITIATWVRPDYSITQESSLVILGKRESINGQIAFQLALMSPRQQRLRPGAIQLSSAISGNSDDRALATTVYSPQHLPPSGEWVHVVAVGDRNHTRFYINGEFVGEAEGVMSIGNDAPLLIGASNISSDTSASVFHTFVGLIDEVAIFDRPLDEDEARWLYENSIEGGVQSRNASGGNVQ